MRGAFIAAGSWLLARHEVIADPPESRVPCLALAVILGFVGLKMLATDLIRVPVAASLAVVGGVLLVTVLAPLAHARAGDRNARGRASTAFPDVNA